MAALAPLTRLGSLALGSCAPVTAGGLAALGALRELARLDLRDCVLTDAAAHALAHLPLADVRFTAVAPELSPTAFARSPARRCTACSSPPSASTTR